MSKEGTANTIFLYNFMKCSFPNLPLITAVERYKLGKLALGNKCPYTRFFLGLTEMDETTQPSSSTVSVRCEEETFC